MEQRRRKKKNKRERGEGRRSEDGEKQSSLRIPIRGISVSDPTFEPGTSREGVREGVEETRPDDVWEHHLSDSVESGGC